MEFYKYHALGNDYLVYQPTSERDPFSSEEIIRICHRHYGLGSDGILWGATSSEVASFRLQIFNPDGSEAEKSGNGLRIFARYLFDQGLVNAHQPFTIETAGGIVTATVNEKSQSISVEMGVASFNSEAIPM